MASKNLMSLLVPSEENIRTGVVDRKLSTNKYVVRVGSSRIPVRSAIQGSFKLGTKVIVAQNKQAKYIVGRASVRGAKRKEVIVDG